MIAFVDWYQTWKSFMLMTEHGEILPLFHFHPFHPSLQFVILKLSELKIEN